MSLKREAASPGNIGAFADLQQSESAEEQ